MSKLDGVLADLAVEGDLLESLVAGLSGAQWRTPTPAKGWDVATQIAHLAWTDEVAVLAATDRAGWEAIAREAAKNPSGFTDAQAALGAAASPADLLSRWAAARPRLARALQQLPPGDKLP